MKMVDRAGYKVLVFKLHWKSDACELGITFGAWNYVTQQVRTIDMISLFFMFNTWMLCVCMLQQQYQTHQIYGYA